MRKRYARQAKAAGRLVLHADGSIDPAASDARRAATTDPSKQRVRLRKPRKTAVSDTLREHGMTPPVSATDLGETRLWSATGAFDVRVREIPNPRPGDRLILGDEVFVIQGEPLRDSERLVWTLDARPA